MPPSDLLFRKGRKTLPDIMDLNPRSRTLSGVFGYGSGLRVGGGTAICNLHQKKLLNKENELGVDMSEHHNIEHAREKPVWDGLRMNLSS